MVDGAMPKPLGDLANAFLVAMVTGAILVGWLNSRDWLGRRPRGKDETPLDGWLGDDGSHHQGWWSGGDADGGHHGDSGGDGH